VTLSDKIGHIEELIDKTIAQLLKHRNLLNIAGLKRRVSRSDDAVTRQQRICTFQNGSATDTDVTSFANMK
jgi:hypothetical protein